MNLQHKNNFRTLAAMIGLAFLLSAALCSPGNNSTPITPNPNAPGGINGKLNLHLGGNAPTLCTAPEVTWTVSSTAGSPQSKKSPAITLNDNVTSQCETGQIEGTNYTICSCPVSTYFTSLAPGTWTIQAGSVTCSVKVKPSITSVVNLYDDGRSCTTVP